MPRFLAALTAVVLTIGYSAGIAQAQQAPNPTRITEAAKDALKTLREVEASQRAEAAAWAGARRLPTSLRQSDGRRVSLVGFDAGRPAYLTSLNRAAAQTTSTQALYPGGGLGLTLTGQDLEIGLWDGGTPLATHQEFQGGVDNREPADTEDHATHVAGTLAARGVRAEARGMAYAARLRAYDWDNDAAEMAGEAARGVLLSNHSYGLIAGWYYGDLEGDGDQWYWLGDATVSDREDYTFGWYDVDSAQFDRVAFTNLFFLPVVAAGNDRGDRAPTSGSYRALNEQGDWQTYQAAGHPRPRDGGDEGYDTIAGAAVAKNVLTVGSIGLSGTGQPRASAFSSFGPTDDGRVKPDLVGYGEGVLSSTAGGPTSYGRFSGTSMATPNVAGSLALLQQHRFNLTGAYLRAATLKGLALHTARDLGAPGPDYQYGWGLLDAEAAAEHLTEALANGLAVTETALQDGRSFAVAATVAEAGPLRVTLSWTDPTSSRLRLRGASSLDDPTPHLRNDLDLRVVNDATGEVYLPFTLDPRQPSRPATPGDNVVDPVEQVYVARVPAGAYTFIVSHKGRLISGDPQTFSLLVTGAARAARPVAVSHLAAEASVARVLLTWKTQFERSAGSFIVLRAPVTYAPDGTRSIGAFAQVGVMEVGGASEQTLDYTFEEARVPAGRYLYRLFFEGSASYLTAEAEANVPAPERYAVLSNYPNPFREQTRVVLDLPEPQRVTLDVYDALGRRVQRVYDGSLPAGRHELPVTAAHWSPGIYFARLVTPHAARSHRMVVLR